MDTDTLGRRRILHSRKRVVALRVTEDEFRALEALVAEQRARSISDLVHGIVCDGLRLHTPQNRRDRALEESMLQMKRDLAALKDVVQHLVEARFIATFPNALATGLLPSSEGPRPSIPAGLPSPRGKKSWRGTKSR